MRLIPLNKLDAHPSNANRMAPDLFEKLKAHVRSSGNYPPLIVRKHPKKAGRYQILDGHHRARALRELRHRVARCVVWKVRDEHHAALLLLTLNRLHGEDDPKLRGRLLEQLGRCEDIQDLAELLPDSEE